MMGKKQKKAKTTPVSLRIQWTLNFSLWMPLLMAVMMVVVSMRRKKGFHICDSSESKVLPLYSPNSGEMESSSLHLLRRRRKYSLRSPAACPNSLGSQW